MSGRYTLQHDGFCVIHSVNSKVWRLHVSVNKQYFCSLMTQDRGLSELVTVETVHLQTKIASERRWATSGTWYRDQICRRKASVKEIPLITVGQTSLLIMLRGSMQPQRKLGLVINGSLPSLMLQNAPRGCLWLLTAAMEQNLKKIAASATLI